MQIRDYFKIFKAKIKDATISYAPAGFFEELARIESKLKNSEPTSKEFGEAMDDLWLSSRQNINYFKRTLSVLEGLREKDKTRPEELELLDDLASITKITLDSAKVISEQIRIHREEYHNALREERIFNQVLSATKNPLEKEVENAN